MVEANRPRAGRASSSRTTRWSPSSRPTMTAMSTRWCAALSAATGGVLERLDSYGLGAAWRIRPPGIRRPSVQGRRLIICAHVRGETGASFLGRGVRLSVPVQSLVQSSFHTHIALPPSNPPLSGAAGVPEVVLERLCNEARAAASQPSLHFTLPSPPLSSRHAAPPQTLTPHPSPRAG